MVSKFSAPLERTARLLDLVPYISSHQGISLKELAKLFKVDESQMTSDLTTLWMCGLPGYTPLELMDLNFESGFAPSKFQGAPRWNEIKCNDPPRETSTSIRIASAFTTDAPTPCKPPDAP